MAGRPKLPKSLTIEREKQVWDMRIRGATYERIGENLGITPMAVGKILVRLHKRYRDQHMQDISLLKSEQLSVLSHIEDEAMQAWERNDRIDPSYLKVVIQAAADKRKVMGIDCPTRTETRFTFAELNESIDRASNPEKKEF